jgi:rhamnose transport system ATP-binding protein
MSQSVDRGVPTLELRDVSKAFGQVIALRSGSLTLYPGSIHALVGENGAGKSTLVKIMAGLYQRDSGTFEMEGKPVDFKTTAEAKAAGIAVIYQEPTLFPDLSVTENVFMGRQPVGRFRRIDRKAMRTEVRGLMERLGVRIDADRPAEGLSIADQQIIEIAKAISLDAKVLIMDEPTAALSGVEVERLFAVARSLRDEGRALMFISHRFDEVFALCDTITVMRDGAYISTDAAAQTDVPQIVRRMVGRDVNELFPKQEAKIGDPLLVVDGLSMPGVFHDISVTVRSGEIVGLAGLVGAGRSEVARAIFGVDPYEAGSVAIGGTAVPPRDPRASAALLQSHPNLKGIIAPTTVGIGAAARYLSTSKAKGKVALTGLGTPNQMREYVKDGTVKEFALWNPHDLGYFAAYATKSLITGEIKGSEGDKFTAGKLGEYTVGADNTVVLGDPYKFNKDNIDQFKF